MSIRGEVYELTEGQFESLMAGEPPNLYLSEVVLDGGERVEAMLYPRALVEEHRWPDVSAYGGWARYMALRGSRD